GRFRSVLVPLANPARAGGLASLASALAPQQAGRVLLHQVVVANAETGEDDLRKAMQQGNAALSNALARTHRAGVKSEILLTVASEPWSEIARIAREQAVTSVLLGLAQAPAGEAPADAPGAPAHSIDQLMGQLHCNVSVLHAVDDFDLDRVRRVLIPLSGHNDHDRLRARVIGTLARKGLDQLRFLHVLAPDAPAAAERRAAAALQHYVQDEARGRGDALVVRAEDAIAEIVAQTSGFDLLVLGVTRQRGGPSRIGVLLARMVREASCPVLIISHLPARGDRGGRPF
ncbi:MAG TPA: universal stress protein, partial [Egibacteraceae bacterium]|nr:universal stress protein [Egibacteraceae bacterium]